MIEFEVFGTPIPKGSMKAYLRPGMKFPVVTADNTRTKPWAQEVSRTAMQFRQDPLWAGPVSLAVTFQLPRPKSLPKRTFSFHLRKPDEDKLLRNIKDALTGIVYLDDAQVVECHIRKQYAYLPSAIISIRALGIEHAHEFTERHLLEGR